MELLHGAVDKETLVLSTRLSSDTEMGSEVVQWNSVGMVMLVYDATSKESFDNCAMWLDMLKKHRIHKDRPIQGASQDPAKLVLWISF